MADDITSRYKTAVSYVNEIATDIFSEVQRGEDFYKITYPNKIVYVYAKLVSPISTDKVIYDISFVGPGIELELDSSNEICGGSVSSSIIVSNILTGFTVSPGDDPTVEKITESDFDNAADTLATFIKKSK